LHYKSRPMSIGRRSMSCSVNMSQRGSEEPSVGVARRVASVVRTCIERDGHRKTLCLSGRNKPPVSRIREKKQANDTKVLTDAAFVVRQLLRRFPDEGFHIAAKVTGTRDLSSLLKSLKRGDKIVRIGRR